MLSAALCKSGIDVDSPYSMSSSAMVSTSGGMVTPSAIDAGRHVGRRKSVFSGINMRVATRPHVSDTSDTVL